MICYDRCNFSGINCILISTELTLKTKSKVGEKILVFKCRITLVDSFSNNCYCAVEVIMLHVVATVLEVVIC